MGDPFTEARVRQQLEEAFSSLVQDDPLSARRSLRRVLQLDPTHGLAKQMLEEIESPTKSSAEAPVRD